MKKIISLILVIVLFSSNLAYAQKINSVENVKLGNNLDSFINYLVEKEKFNGNVLIMKGGETLVRKSYGYKDSEAKLPLSVEDKFLIGSVTKEFVAVSILQLEEKGLLDTKDKLSKYFPEYKYGNDMTIENLLIHNSGLKDIINRTSLFSNTGYIDAKDEDIYLNIINSELNFKPGEKYEYSNTNYYLLSLIIEKITNTSLENYLIENIFRPLDMQNTGSLKAGQKDVNISPNPVLINLTIDEEIGLVSKSKGAGYLYSTLDDLYKWDRALYTNKLLKAESLNKLITPVVKINGLLNNAYGFRVREDKNYGRKVYQNGNTIGFTSSFNRYIDKDISIILLTNIGEYDVNNFMNPVEKIIFNNNLNYRKTAAINENVVGEYVTFPKIYFKIIKKDGNLYFKLGDFKDSFMFPVNENELSMVNTKVKLKFNASDNIITSVKISPYNIVGIKYK